MNQGARACFMTLMCWADGSTHAAPDPEYLSSSSGQCWEDSLADVFTLTGTGQRLGRHMAQTGFHLAGCWQLHQPAPLPGQS